MARVGTSALAAVEALARSGGQGFSVALVFGGSDGAATLALFEELKGCGPVGILATCLFRAQKAVNRARDIPIDSSPHYPAMAHGRRLWALSQLLDYIRLGYDGPSIAWGWRPSEDQHEKWPWILSMDLPQGQVSFRSAVRHQGPDYVGKWDGVKGANTQRILAFVNSVLQREGPPHAAQSDTPRAVDERRSTPSRRPRRRVPRALSVG